MKPLTQSRTLTAVEPVRAERRARRFWASMVVGLLSAQVVGGIATVYLATSDSSFSVVPNYYQAGLNWDVTKRNRDLFTSLGWNCQVTVSESDSELKHRSVLIQLRSETDQPVAGLKVKGQIYHHARGNDVHELQFDQATPGDYVASIQLAQGGIWQVNLTLEGDHGIAEENLVVHVDSR